MNDEFKTQYGLSAELPLARAIIKTYDSVCEKCGLNMEDVLFTGWKSIRKYQNCTHSWKDVLVKTEIVGGEANEEK